MKILTEISVLTGGFLLWLLMVAVNSTLKIEVIGLNNIPRDNVIFAVWHQATFPLFYSYRKFCKGRKASVLTTDIKRGRVIEYVAKLFSYRVFNMPVRKKTSESLKVMIAMVRDLEKGRDLVLAVDGPFGPIFKVGKGPLLISKQSGKGIVPVGAYAERKWVMKKRWDKYFIPLPFSRVRIVFGKPLKIRGKSSEKDMEKSRKELEERLFRLTADAKHRA